LHDIVKNEVFKVFTGPVLWLSLFWMLFWFVARWPGVSNGLNCVTIIIVVVVVIVVKLLLFHEFFQFYIF